MFRIHLRVGAVANPLCETGFAVLASVPFIHATENLLTLPYGQLRSLGDDVEIAVGDDGGDLDDIIPRRIQTGHFQVDPDKAVRILTHGLKFP